jgi:hypothetical protein
MRAQMLSMLFVLAGWHGIAKAADPAAIQSMNDYLWSNRPLLVFAPEPDHPIVAAQRLELSGRDGNFHERDMVYIEVVAGNVSIDGQPAPGLDASELQGRYRLNAGQAAALLVGKDGGVKLRSSEALDAAALFDTIDAMPMRQREMGKDVGDGG